MLAGDGERHLGQRRARRGDSGLAEEGEGEGLARLRGVERPALELHGVQAVELRMIGAVQIDEEGTLQAPGGGHVGGVPRVAEADALERLALRRDGPARPGELDAEEVPLARSLTRLPRPRGRRGASRAAGRGRGLHGLVLVRRDLDMQRHDPGQTEEVRVGGLPLGVPVIRGPDSGDTVPARTIAEQINADRCGEGSSTHGVTSRGDDRRADEGPSSLGQRSHPAAAEAPTSTRCEPRMSEARRSCFFVAVP